MSVRKIVRISSTSRLIVFLFQLLFNYLLKDHNADAFKGKQFNRLQNQSSKSDRIVFNCLDGLNKWDSRYFITISKFGFEEPSWTAFFPFYPILINLLSDSLNTVLDLNYPTINFLSAYLINLICFTISCISLYKLTICLFNNKLFAINTVKWFAYNPATIFFSATYTESLYSSLSFTAILLLYQRFPKIQREQNFHLILHNKPIKYDENRYSDQDSFRDQYEKLNFKFYNYGDKNDDKFVKLFSHKLDLVKEFLNEKCKFLIAIICFTLASLTRSNGIINIGFFWYLFILDNFKLIFYRKIGKLFNFNNLIQFTVLLLSTCLVVSPLFIVQYINHYKFCPNESSLIGKMNRVDNLPGKVSNDQICKIQFWKFYSFVQEKYWNVGLFKYYQFKKIPNFLLATPMLILVIVILKYFIESTKASSNLVKKGLGDQFWNRTALLFPFVLHLLFLTSFSVLFINIEVITRLLCSSSPLPFWSICKLPRKMQNYVKIYFLIYFFTGIFMFSNFLPWT